MQTSVHEAVKDLLAEGQRPVLSVPMVAARAGVTPSTIYRRWGSLNDLLADVAADRLRPDDEPLSTGTLRGDLTTWTRSYLEELSSTDGRLFLRDVVAGHTGAACRCAQATRAQMDLMLARAAGRGEHGPSAQEVVDHVIAPLVYALLFDDTTPGPSRADELIDDLL